MATGQYLQLKITLKDTHPPVWRRVLIPDDMRLDKLHLVIQVLFGWENAHLHQFWNTQARDLFFVPSFDEDFMGDEELESDVKALDELEFGNLIYQYDFGDDWQHQIHLEKIIEADTTAVPFVPYCLTGRGANFEEDSRGDESMRGDEFNRDKINATLKKMFPHSKKSRKKATPKAKTTLTKVDPALAKLAESLKDEETLKAIVNKKNKAFLIELINQPVAGATILKLVQLLLETHPPKQ
ncbi:plasmid pRiA4b ORF-3 family protein [Lacticaseibacillus chiayiensis]|uniref:plasmid pRiA4b ORF-3 family protein n=1 Tax=Lacticaseibacillus chiayiensis TaxID=2100821 RepID=UPI0010104179|nr:plasmid pRiA4b ORF-3 family protein [Lacticaseibacillus chiayiensis]RXT57818.1 hypothetical protein CHT97_10135 [Lacticaseibacillus chiayiensis]